MEYFPLKIFTSPKDQEQVKEYLYSVPLLNILLILVVGAISQGNKKRYLDWNGRIRTVFI